MLNTRFQRIAPYIADAAATVFTTCGALLLVFVVAELRDPGTAARYLSPQALAGLAIAALVAAAFLAEPSTEGARPGFLARAGYALAGMIAAAAAAGTAWNAFADVAALRLPYTVAAALTIAASFILFRRSRRSA